ncbi:hypothetical protein GCM10020219_069940 [Nonomuraea dietziae]
MDCLVMRADTASSRLLRRRRRLPSEDLAGVVLGLQEAGTSNGCHVWSVRAVCSISNHGRNQAG